MNKARPQNQADYWNGRQALAKTPREVAAIWFDACRMVARQSEKSGDQAVWTDLAANLQNFFKNYTQ